jgi:hypothetical protein
MNSEAKTIRGVFERNEGILRLEPVFIAYPFSKPGRRLKLHPNDYYAFGTERGAVKERWLSSVMPGEGRASHVESPNGECISLIDFVRELGAELIGGGLMAKHGTFPMHAKFFDYAEPLFHHLHLTFESAALTGKLGKPEAYYYPPQMNNYAGTFPHTYFGFAPDVTREEVRERLMNCERNDTRITELSRAYRIELGTGWYTPPGILHAPGSYLTYEPQLNSTAGAVFENITAGEINAIGRDTDYLMSLLDWEKNVDPYFRKKYFRPPIVRTQDECHTEKWITYANDYFAATELTVNPGCSAVIKDEAAYGCVFVQGHGKFGVYDAETPIMIRINQKSADEYFVSEQAARGGVSIVNRSKFEPMVILKHFADNHPDAPREV